MVDFLGKPDPNVINEEVGRLMLQTELMGLMVQIHICRMAIENNFMPVAEAFERLEEHVAELQRIAAS